MYFNENEKNDTNIDNELDDNSHRFDFLKHKDLIIAILLGFVSLIILIISILS